VLPFGATRFIDALGWCTGVLNEPSGAAPPLATTSDKTRVCP